MRDIRPDGGANMESSLFPEVSMTDRQLRRAESENEERLVGEQSVHGLDVSRDERTGWVAEDSEVLREPRT